MVVSILEDIESISYILEDDGYDVSYDYLTGSSTTEINIFSDGSTEFTKFTKKGIKNVPVSRDKRMSYGYPGEYDFGLCKGILITCSMVLDISKFNTLGDLGVVKDRFLISKDKFMIILRDHLDYVDGDISFISDSSGTYVISCGGTTSTQTSSIQRKIFFRIKVAL